MRLADVLDRLSEFDSEDTIYASEPWTEDSDAMVAREPDQGGVPPEASDAGMKYFLEVSIAQEFEEDWLASLEERPTLPTTRQRLIDYAINDA
ncbi:hypothetical protein [Iodidimonas sp. SYSU 1G8]|uniref:hypothetical protein n=1 Tax=Iodidimonas sp. SYSU 1G8 TaxID=3133967 RepID=UPI0031FE8B3A